MPLFPAPVLLILRSNACLRLKHPKKVIARTETDTHAEAIEAFYAINCTLQEVIYHARLQLFAHAFSNAFRILSARMAN